MAWPRVQANVSVISTENASRSQYETSVHEESSIKFIKNAPAPILHSSKASHVTRLKHYTGHIVCSTLSSPPYYLLLVELIYTS